MQINTDQNCGIDPDVDQYWSMPITTKINRLWSALRSISNQCQDFDWYWLPFISIGHWSRESWSTVYHHVLSWPEGVIRVLQCVDQHWSGNRRGSGSSEEKLDPGRGNGFIILIITQLLYSKGSFGTCALYGYILKRESGGETYFLLVIKSEFKWNKSNLQWNPIFFYFLKSESKIFETTHHLSQFIKTTTIFPHYFLKSHFLKQRKNK